MESSLKNDKFFQSIVFLFVLLFGVQIGLEVYTLPSSNGQNSTCSSGIIKERIETIEPTSEDGVNKIMKYYKLECDDGTISKVKAFKSFPLETRIGKEWVRQ